MISSLLAVAPWIAGLSFTALVVAAVVWFVRGCEIVSTPGVEACSCDCGECDEGEQLADANLDRAIAAWKESLIVQTPEEQDASWRKIEPHLARYDYPMDLPIGTLGNPVISSLGHPAYASTLKDLIGGRE